MMHTVEIHINNKAALCNEIGIHKKIMDREQMFACLACIASPHTGFYESAELSVMQQNGTEKTEEGTAGPLISGQVCQLTIQINLLTYYVPRAKLI